MFIDGAIAFVLVLFYVLTGEGNGTRIFGIFWIKRIFSAGLLGGHCFGFWSWFMLWPFDVIT